MSKIRFNRKRLSELNRRIIVRDAAVIAVAAIQVIGFSGCGKEKNQSVDTDNMAFTYDLYDQEALDEIPYNIKGVKNIIVEGDINFGKERELEKKYVFDIGKYYSFVL